MLQRPMRFEVPLLTFLLVTLWVTSTATTPETLPAQFSLNGYGMFDFVTSVKSQQGGTCWAHGAMAAMEGNLLMSGTWTALGEDDEPDLAEYHLDWWNGFNQYNNDDAGCATSLGLEVHYGGDYRVTAAAFSRGDGAVRDMDGQSFDIPPLRHDPSYHYFYPRDVEWYVAGEDLSNIDIIKLRVMNKGVMGTCMSYNGDLIDGSIHYQPPGDSREPNHAIAIVGWDDDKETQAPLPGAWECKNSWGSGWGEGGFFWISYYDKYCAQHPDMGAVAFLNVERLQYDQFYYHDYHGWRDTYAEANEAFNVFEAVGGDVLSAVSFYTAVDNVDYTVVIYDDYIDGSLSGTLATVSGHIDYTGFHTIDLEAPIFLSAGDRFCVYLHLSQGGHAYDRTSTIDVLLGAKSIPLIKSVSHPGESYYLDGAGWQDIIGIDTTANFCIKGLGNRVLSFEQSTNCGNAPLEVTFNALCTLEVTGWNWGFGDGGISNDVSPVHTYNEAGVYDVSIETKFDGSPFRYDKEACVFVTGDTLSTGTIEGAPGWGVEVTVSIVNHVPLRTICIPLEYPGDLIIRRDSFTVSGCRTDPLFDATLLQTDPFNRRFFIKLTQNTATWLPPLQPGEGPILKIYFSVDESAIPGATADLIFDGYESWTPTMTTVLPTGDVFTYLASSSAGSISVAIPDCYMRGDFDHNQRVDVADIVAWVRWSFEGGEPPVHEEECDMDASGQADVADIVYWVNWAFHGGDPPVPCPQ